MTLDGGDLDVESSEEKLTFINGKLVPYDGTELHKKDKKTGESFHFLFYNLTDKRL